MAGIILTIFPKIWETSKSMTVSPSFTSSARAVCAKCPTSRGISGRTLYCLVTERAGQQNQLRKIASKKNTWSKAFGLPKGIMMYHVCCHKKSAIKHSRKMKPSQPNTSQNQPMVVFSGSVPQQLGHLATSKTAQCASSDVADATRRPGKRGFRTPKSGQMITMTFDHTFWQNLRGIFIYLFKTDAFDNHH